MTESQPQWYLMPFFNATHGSVKLWKYTTLGLELSSLTGSKLSLQILNRLGHSISYSEAKGLETEFAYLVELLDRDSPGGIQLYLYLATASVCDNNDASAETLDGKATLHATVGHTYQNVQPETKGTTPCPSCFREGKNRRKFVGTKRESRHSGNLSRLQSSQVQQQQLLRMTQRFNSNH